MPKINLKTIDSNDIIIDVIQNDFTYEFLDFLSNNNIAKITKERINFAPEIKNWDLYAVRELESECKQVVQELNDLGFNFPLLPDQIKFQNPNNLQNLLNQLHRYFTTGSKSGNCWMYAVPNQFNIVGRTDIFYNLINKINSIVHIVEYYAATDHKHNFKSKYTEYEIRFDYSNFNQADIMKEIKAEHLQYFSMSADYDVWLAHCILGKTFDTCYFDMDDPREHDIMADQFYDGSLLFSDKAILRDAQIQNWLKSYGITVNADHFGMPIGKIISGKELVPIIKNTNITNVTVEK
jgi:hypothetical protein